MLWVLIITCQVLDIKFMSSCEYILCQQATHNRRVSETVMAPPKQSNYKYTDLNSTNILIKA